MLYIKLLSTQSSLLTKENQSFKMYANFTRFFFLMVTHSNSYILKNIIQFVIFKLEI